MTHFNPPDASDVFAHAMASVAHELLGEPNRQLSNQHELRFGTHGSLSVDLHRGVWHDHEGGAGGGVLDLIVRERGGKKHNAIQWLKSQGHLLNDQPRQEPRLMTAYDYTDESGNLLFQVCRMEPKTFFQRQPDGRGGWIKNIKQVRQVPYRLPPLINAKDGITVYVVEGEKDADRLADKGLIATTNAGGAGKWRTDFADYFAGKRVAILPDNDEAGRDHARKVLASLRTNGVEANVINLPDLPDKGDVSDWIDKGGSVEALQKLYDLATDEGRAKAKGEFSLIRADALELVEPEFVIDGIMETEALAMLFAEPGSGKSFVALDMGASVAAGQGFHGRGVKRGAVIYICGEGKSGIKRRLTAWEKHHGASLHGAPLFVSSIAGQFLNPESIKSMIAAIDAVAREAGEVALIIIDTLNRCMGAGDESSTADMSAFIRAVDEVKARYAATALIVHHTGHGNKERARGSTALVGAMDAEYRIEKADNLVIMQATKLKEGKQLSRIAFRMEEVKVGRTSRGEAITSAALSEAEAPELRAQCLSPNQRMALDALHQFVSDYGQPAQGGTGGLESGSKRCVQTEAFMDFLKGKIDSDNPDSRRRMAKRALDDLVSKGKAQRNHGYIWIL